MTPRLHFGVSLRRFAVCAALAMALAFAPVASARDTTSVSLTDNTIVWPSLGQILRVLSLRDYNTAVVAIGVSCLGLASGLIGVFMLLRKRALLGDALSHATLPGLGLAFILLASLGQAGKSLPVLLAGATITGVLGVVCILAIVRLTRIKEDAAIGIVLSVFFGLGIAILGVIQSMNTGHQAGLKSFIYGKTASMLASDARMIAVSAVLVTAACLLLFKEFAITSFDTAYAQAQGWPVLLLDGLMMALAVLVTVIGLQAVGLILIVALVVIPPAAARFWTHHLPTLVAISGTLGAVSGLVGAILSALVPRLPAGAVIVLVAGAMFAVSMIFGPARGVLRRVLERRALSERVAAQNLLRAMHELTEAAGQPAGDEWAPAEAPPVTVHALRNHRSWTEHELRRTISAARRVGLVASAPGGEGLVLTARGWDAARRVVRNHRLWELFLIEFAEFAPSQVDRDADAVEHVLDPEMVAHLETQLARTHPDLVLPASPHALVAGRGINRRTEVATNP